MSYNAGMRANQRPVLAPPSGSEPEISAWLRNGGWVVAASERAARAITASYHRARQAEGLAAWPAPAILDWQRFLRGAWELLSANATGDGRLLLDALQEQAIWAQIAGSEQQLATHLEGPLYRLAKLAMEAHKLICSYAPRFLNRAERSGWQQDADSFSNWLAAFDAACRTGNLLSPARLPLELIEPLQSTAASGRPPLLLAGFDRVLPVQRSVFDGWGAWQPTATVDAAHDVRFYQAADTRSELIACAAWCKQQLAENPEARLLIITQEIAQRRGEIERAFLNFVTPRESPSSSSPPFEFSLGIALSQVALARGAHHVLRFLTSDLEEHELDWLISTGQIAAEPYESSALETYMWKLRDRGLERPQWSLGAFLSQTPSAILPAAWSNRMVFAQRRLADHTRAERGPFEWAELVPQILEAAGWPGARSQSSEEFQALRRWEQTVEACAGLGFDGRHISWKTFLAALKRALDETLFAPESHDAPIQVSGPAEAAGLTANAIWFMGATEDAWPSKGAMHPLLPPEVQRAAGMPHATALLDWELARTVTMRLLQSAPRVVFSYPRQNEDGETRFSRIVGQLAVTPEPLPAEFSPPPPSQPLAAFIEDWLLVPFEQSKVEGGSAVLTRQSQCPFKAFATSRLAAVNWRSAEAGLTPPQRGVLLHAVLHSIWGAPPPDGIRTLKDLVAGIEDRAAFIAHHVSWAMQDLRRGVRERMPRRYLELEEQRLNRLVAEWLDYETSRVEFEVVQTEDQRPVEIAGLGFDLRLDRLDRLNDGTLLVIDYKTGNVSTKAWEPPRPDDVQLPLYASFALQEEETLGGLAFAQVRHGQLRFSGHVADAQATLFAGIKRSNPLVKNNLTAEMVSDWRERIEALARDFLAGRSETDPREYPKTCKNCGLEALCRIHEIRASVDEDQSPFETGEEDADE